MNKITILNDYQGDWTGLYVNGEFKYANHSICRKDLNQYMPIESIEEIDLEDYENCTKYLEEYGNFPQNETLTEFLNK